MVAVFLIAITLLMLTIPFIFPVIIILAGHILRRNAPDISTTLPANLDTWPKVSVLIPIHCKSGVIKKKLHDIASSDYPKDRLEIILVLDGAVKGIESALSQFKKESSGAPELKVIRCKRSGKNTVLNKAAENASGSILIFTDADARLDSAAIRHLIGIFSSSDVGGGCGLHLLSSKKGAQRKYWDIESSIKAAEQKLLGSITASYGTISAIRKELFVPIPTHVADDLYLALLVISKGKRFSFCPQSQVYIEKPSKTLVDEMTRRRRIVSQSLSTLNHFRGLLNPLKNGAYAICLICHKLLRRLVPFNAIVLFLICLWQGLQGSQFFIAFTLIQISIYTLLGTLLKRAIEGKTILRHSGVFTYFFATNIGMLLGTIDFVRGKTHFIWE